MTLFASNVHSGGFYANPSPTMGKHISLMREQRGGFVDHVYYYNYNVKNRMTISEVRAYGMPNLIQSAASVSIEAPMHVGGQEAASLIRGSGLNTARTACSDANVAVIYESAEGAITNY